MPQTRKRLTYSSDYTDAKGPFRLLCGPTDPILIDGQIIQPPSLHSLNICQISTMCPAVC